MTQDELRSAQVTSKLMGVIDVGSRVRAKDSPMSHMPATVTRRYENLDPDAARCWYIRYDDDGPMDEWQIAESRLELI